MREGNKSNRATRIYCKGGDTGGGGGGRRGGGGGAKLQAQRTAQQLDALKTQRKQAQADLKQANKGSGKEAAAKQFGLRNLVKNLEKQIKDLRKK